MLLISAPYQASHLRPRPHSLALTMPFFEGATKFSITNATMNDVAGNYEENNTTKNTTISDSNNTTTETTTNSHNDRSRSFVKGGFATTLTRIRDADVEESIRA